MFDQCFHEWYVVQWRCRSALKMGDWRVVSHSVPTQKLRDPSEEWFCLDRVSYPEVQKLVW